MKTISKEVLYLGLDVHAENIAVAIAEAGRDGEVRNYGEIPNTFHSVDKLMRKLGDPDKELRVCSGECLASFLSWHLSFPGIFPFLTINLTKEERQSLPKVGDKTPAFDEKCKAYMASRPELVPGFIDMAELAKDRKTVADLLPCPQEIAPICEGLEDTVSLAYTDIYIADLAFHANVKQAAKRGVPDTDTIYDDLKARFPGRTRTEPTPPPVV